MKYYSVSDYSNEWKLSERTVRHYCSMGRVPGAVLSGKTWRIPANAKRPPRKKRFGKIPTDLLERLRLEKASGIKGGIYHRIQIDMTYNSNHMEGSRLTHDQTRHIFETNTIGAAEAINVDDIVETVNHFRCIDLMIDMANYPLSESMLRQLHLILKSGTADSRKPWFAVGAYKRLENEVGGLMTTAPEQVAAAMKALLKKYNAHKEKTFEEIVEFHYEFERIHPFQDGNGRIGRLIMFKECLRNKIAPFIIEDNLKAYYYRGLAQWPEERGYLIGTCLSAQDKFKEMMEEFGCE